MTRHYFGINYVSKLFTHKFRLINLTYSALVISTYSARQALQLSTCINQNKLTFSIHGHLQSRILIADLYMWEISYHTLRWFAALLSHLTVQQI